MHLFFVITILLVGCGKKEDSTLRKTADYISHGNLQADLFSINTDSNFSFGKVFVNTDNSKFTIRFHKSKRNQEYQLMILDGFNCPLVDRNTDGMIDGHEILMESGPVIVDVNQIGWDFIENSNSSEIFSISHSKLWDYLTHADSDSSDYLTKIPINESFDFEERPVIILEALNGKIPDSFLSMPGRPPNELPVACGKLKILSSNQEEEVDQARPVTRVRNRLPELQDDIEVPPVEVQASRSRWTRFQQRIRQWWRRVNNSSDVLN